VFWLFWLGLFVIAMVLFIRGGALGILDRLLGLVRRASTT
jgi:hypothetical protein